MGTLIENGFDKLPSKPKVYAFVSVLLFLVVSSLGMSVFTIKGLQWEDHISIPRGTMLFIYGLIFFTALYHALNYIFLHTSTGIRLANTYSLSKEFIMDINNKQVSAVQAIFSSITGMTICSYSCPKDIFRTSHYISEAYGWFGAAYFFYDIWSMYNVQQASLLSLKQGAGARKTLSFLQYIVKNPMIVAHHLFIGIVGFLAVTFLKRNGDCFYGFIYLMEASTPFVSIRGILSKLGLKETKYYVINGFLMLGTFFLFRIFMFPAVMYLYAHSLDVNLLTAINSLSKGSMLFFLALFLPQIYWFYLMLKGATKVLKPSKKAIKTD